MRTTNRSLTFCFAGRRFRLMGTHDAVERGASALTCRDIVEAIRAHPHHLIPDNTLNRFLGLKISASGKITNQDRVGFGLGCITEVVDDHGTIVLCNFRKPAPRDVADLQKGALIRVRGVVSNATSEAVVLSDCELEN